MSEVIPEIVIAVCAAINETGVAKLFSASFTTDDPAEIIARGKYILAQFGPLSENSPSWLMAMWLAAPR